MVLLLGWITSAAVEAMADRVKWMETAEALRVSICLLVAAYSSALCQMIVLCSTASTVSTASVRGRSFAPRYASSIR